MESVKIPVEFYLGLIGEYLVKVRILEIENQKLETKLLEAKEENKKKELQRIHEENTAKRARRDVEEEIEEEED